MSTIVRRSGLKALAAGNAVAQVAALIRYTILARILGPEELGLAAILILTSQFFEQITDAGLDRFLVQSRVGNRRSTNAAVHLFLILRGIVLAVAIALSAGVLSDFFHRPELRGGLMLLALSPLVFGFSHFDFRRVQRHHRFAAEGQVTMAAELVALVVTVIAAIALHSHIAIAIALIARSAANVIVSHLVARRPYRIGFARQHLRAMSAFGLPLMLNGILLFVSGQGDRLFIGNQIGAAELGHYSAVILLILYPATMLSRFINSLNMPAIAGLRDRPVERREAIDRSAGEVLLLAVAMTLGFAAVAPVVIPLLYGPEFALPLLQIAMIGALQTSRFLRTWPVAAALAAGHSRILLWNSIMRLSAFPIAFALRRELGGLWSVVIAFILAEFLAFAVSLSTLHAKGLGTPRRDWSRIALLAGTFAALAGTLAPATPMQALARPLSAALLAVIVAITVVTERTALRALWSIVQRRLPGRLRG